MMVRFWVPTFILIVASIVIYLISKPSLWLLVPSFLAVLSVNFLSMIIEKKTGKQAFKTYFTYKNKLSLLFKFFSVFLPMLAVMSFDDIKNHIDLTPRFHRLIFFGFLCGLTYIWIYAGMLSVILKNEEDQKGKTNDPPV